MPVIINYLLKKRRKKAKVYYDNEIDALYLKLGDEPPEGVNLDTTSEKRKMSF